MTENEILLYGGIAAAFVAVLFIAWWALWRTVEGAVALFAVSLESGGQWTIAYIASWIFILPVMVLASLAVGVCMICVERFMRNDEIHSAKIRQANLPLDEL